MKKNKYIVEDLETGKYLKKDYFKGGRTFFIEDAYQFTAFELKLASVMVLKPNKRYRVYKWVDNGK